MGSAVVSVMSRVCPGSLLLLVGSPARQGGLLRPRPRRVGVEPAHQLLRNQVDSDPAGPAVKIAEDAFAVAEAAQHGLVVVRRLHAEQRHHVVNLDALAGAAREYPAQARSN